jgi:putative FmdB family regulatory protein
MTYDYECEQCGEFEVTQKFGAAPIKNCPHCKGKEVERLISGGLHVFVRGEATTIGQTAERNTKKLGTYELEEKRRYITKPPGHTGTLEKDTYNKLGKMNAEQKQRYIMDGE